MTQNPRDKIEKLLGTAILKNDKNYTDDIMAVIDQHYISKDEILKARPAKGHVNFSGTNNSGSVYRDDAAAVQHGYNQALEYWSKALGIGETE